jgi:hypothetical protein
MKASEQFSLLDEVPVFAGCARIGAGKLSHHGQPEVMRMVRFGGNN